MQKLLKWLPFSVFIIVAFLGLIYLIYYGNNESYYPSTNNPEIIYKQACANCHGNMGEGDIILYPKLVNIKLEKDEIADIISNGSWRMPDFPFITGDTLTKLVEYVFNEDYKK